MKTIIFAFSSPAKVPLLYRWKAFEPACSYAMRGVVVHKLYLRLHRAMMTKRKMKDEAAEWDEDDPDINPGLKQEIRMAKTVKLIHGATYLSDLSKARLISKPLADYMSELSLLESCRRRLYLRAMKFSLPGSKAASSPTETWRCVSFIFSVG